MATETTTPKKSVRRSIGEGGKTTKKSPTKTEKGQSALHATIFDMKGGKAGNISLPEKVFGLPWNGDLVHQVVVSLQSNARIPVAHTKDRSEVRGGGKKPWRQKGTGRARHGSTRSPLWVGGGVTFGPRNDRNYTKKVNKKMRTKALYTILSRKLADGEILFVKELSFSEPKTKTAIETLGSLARTTENAGLTHKRNAALILLSKRDLSTAKSFRNIPSVYVEELRNVNPTLLLSYKHVIIEDPETAVKFLEGKTLTPKT